MTLRKHQNDTIVEGELGSLGLKLLEASRKKMQMTVAVAALATFLASEATAATLSVNTLPNGFFGNTVAVVAEATITSFGTDLFFGGASGVPSSFCAIQAGTCQADLDISFTSVISNLFFDVSGFNVGDSVALGIFGLGNAFLGSVNLLSNISNLDLSGFGSITRLYFDDNSTGAGVAYSDFSFDQVAAIPLPASLPLLIGGLGLLAVARRRKST